MLSHFDVRGAVFTRGHFSGCWCFHLSACYETAAIIKLTRLDHSRLHNLHCQGQVEHLRGSMKEDSSRNL